MKKCSRAPNGRYPAEFREQIVALARTGRSVEDLAREFEPCAATIHGWIKQSERDGGRRSREDLVKPVRRGRATDCGDDIETAADAAAEQAETDYPQTRLRTLVRAGGNEEAIA